MEAEATVRYSVVVPFYNEQESVPPLYMKLTEAMDSIGEPYELVFVDDGSKDNTFKVLAEIYEHDRRVNLIRLRRNFGQTPALKAGFDFARGEVIITMDGDLQHDPEEIPKFLEKIEEGYDLVSGWRYARRDHWLLRQIPSRTANWLMAKLSGVDLHDFGTTFKAYRREIIQEIQLYGELHRFIPALASTTGARIAEVPIEIAHKRTSGSRRTIRRSIPILFDLMMVKFLLDYSNKPLQFFGLIGAGATGLGVLLSLYLGYLKYWAHESAMGNHGPLMLLAVALFIGGVQFLSIGLLGEIIMRIYYESQNKPIYSVREVKSHREESGGSTEPKRQFGSSDH